MSFLLILIFFMHEHYKKVNVQNVCFNVPKKQSNSHPVVLRVIFHSLGGPECVEVYSRQKKPRVNLHEKHIDYGYETRPP